MVRVGTYTAVSEAALEMVMNRLSPLPLDLEVNPSVLHRVWQKARADLLNEAGSSRSTY
jgi:hypothetical protein